MSRPGEELAELLWDNDAPALRTPPFFQPFTCSAAGSSTARELHIKRCHGAMEDDGLGAIIPVHHHGDSDGTAPLPPEYCAGLLACPPAYSGLHAVPDPTPAAQAGVIARPSSTVAVPATAHTQPSAAAGSEGVVNFTFFSRPLQRPAPSPGTGTNPLESSVAQAAATRLRNTPLFSDQRMAWLHPPINKQVPPRACTSVAPPPPAQPPPPPTTDHHVELEAAAQQQHNARATPATATTSSVSSGNGDNPSQARRSGHHQHTAECSFSPDEDMDDEPSAARGVKRSRTAEVHNLSERRRRDRINEKMRALQELVPNCNKIDKASMLEEAIEYLKTLQLQVQMMSMGTAGGLCVPPAMLMQVAAHHHHPMAAPFPHLGMSLGFGMLPRFAQFPFPVMPPGAPMPPGAMFGMLPGQVMTSPFGHVNGAAPAEQRDPAPPAAAHPPVPVAVASQSDQKLQHPRQT